MKVKCIKLFNALGKEVDEHASLSVGKIYNVLEIEVSKASEILYRLAFSSEDPRNASGLFQSICFEVLSNVTPSNWSIAISKEGFITLGPVAWGGDFWMSFYDCDPTALPIFERERAIILQEDP